MIIIINLILIKQIFLKHGDDITIFATGIMVDEAIKASDILEREGVSIELISIPVIKPIDVETVKNSLLKTKKLLLLKIIML